MVALKVIFETFHNSLLNYGNKVKVLKLAFLNFWPLHIIDNVLILNTFDNNITVLHNTIRSLAKEFSARSEIDH